MDLQSYFSGFADGEGSFCVSFNKNKRHKFGWDIRPSFSVSQNRENSLTLEKMREYWDCGFIRPDSSDNTLKYEVRSVSKLVEKIIPHFERFPMLSKKQEEFCKFAEICRMMYERKHLTKEGFNVITNIASKLNLHGKKKFPRLEIKI